MWYKKWKLEGVLSEYFGRRLLVFLFPSMLYTYTIHLPQTLHNLGIR